MEADLNHNPFLKFYLFLALAAGAVFMMSYLFFTVLTRVGRPAEEAARLSTIASITLLLLIIIRRDKGEP